MKNKLITISILILILLGGFLFYSKYRYDNIYLHAGDRDVSSDIGILPIVKDKSDGKYMTMERSYPQTTGSDFKELSDFIKKSKKDFLNDVNQITDFDVKSMSLGVDRKYVYMMETKVVESSQTVTYILNIYEDRGGAHGNTEVMTFTYDGQKKLLKLSDIFDKPYLARLSALSRKYFYDTLGQGAQKDMIDSGTEPVDENFSSWYLTDVNLVIIFGQYQVGPYVLGIQEYPIAKSLLAGILSKSFK